MGAAKPPKAGDSGHGEGAVKESRGWGAGDGKIYLLTIVVITSIILAYRSGGRI
jgi:hypothetical protein